MVIPGLHHLAHLYRLTTDEDSVELCSKEMEFSSQDLLDVCDTQLAGLG